MLELPTILDVSAWLLAVCGLIVVSMVATGVLTIHLALSGARDGSTTAWIVAAVAGAASVGLLAARP